MWVMKDGDRHAKGWHLAQRELQTAVVRMDRVRGVVLLVIVLPSHAEGAFTETK
jgi:hypothetical protein